MKNIQLCLDNLVKRLEKISDYLSSLDVQKSMIRELESEKTNEYFMEYPDEFYSTMMYIEKIKSVALSPVQYNALIISIYGCFEEFIDKLFAEYINLLCLNISNYEELPEKLRDKHLKRLGDFLSNPQRYKNYGVTAQEAIDNCYLLLNSQKTINFGENMPFVLAHSGNITMEQLVELMGELGINDALRKIVNNYNFIMYQKEYRDFTEDIIKRYASNNPSVLFSPLSAIVEARNNVAHGWEDNRSDYNGIRENMICFIECLSKALTEIIISSFLTRQYNRGRFKEFPKAIKVIDNHILCINNKDIMLHIGDYILALTKNDSKVLKIKGIQIDGVSVEEINEENIDIGIEFEKRADKNIKGEYTYCYISII